MTKATIISTQHIAASALNSAVALTIPADAMWATIVVSDTDPNAQGKRVLFRADSTNPTGVANAAALLAGVYEWRGELAKLRFLNETSSGCYLYVIYWSD